jgi:peptidoglycan/LPS O-acetylase OafA/YrhL
LPARGVYIPGIDGLRAVAVGSVILYHINPSFCPSGFVGVDIFFVISGFVVARSVSTNASESFAAFILDFYRRRFFRIYPALLLVVLSTIIFAVLLLPSAPDTNYVLPTGVAALVGMSNVLLYSISGDYFSDIAQFNLFTHTWSLGVEEQFYLIFPPIAALVFSRQKSRSRIGILILVAGAILSFAALGFVGNGAAGFYLVVTRFWEFGLGVLLFLTYIPAFQILSRQRHSSAVAMGGALGLLGYSLVGLDETLFPFPSALAPTLAAVILIGLIATGHGGAAGRILSWHPVVWVGQISYPLYLWHWIVVVAIRWFGPADSLLGIILAFVVTFALAATTHYRVERPIRSWARQRSFRAVPLLVGATLVLCGSVAAASTLMLLAPRLALSSTADRAVWRTTTIPSAALGDCDTTISTVWKHGGRFITIAPAGCNGGTDRPALFIAGDSHAGAYFRLGQRLAARYGVSVVVMTKAGCRTLPNVEDNADPACQNFRSAVMARLQHDARPQDRILISALYLARYRTTFRNDPDAVKDALPDEGTPSSWQPVLNQLLQTGAHIVFEAPKPLLKTAPFRCSDPWTATSAYCRLAPPEFNKSELLSMREPLLRKLRSLAAEQPRTEIWDPFPLLCQSDICSGIEGGRPLFYDTDHLSGYGNDVLVESFARDVLDIHPYTKTPEISVR